MSKFYQSLLNNPDEDSLEILEVEINSVKKIIKDYKELTNEKVNKLSNESLKNNLQILRDNKFLLIELKIIEEKIKLIIKK